AGRYLHHNAPRTAGQNSLRLLFYSASQKGRCRSRRLEESTCYSEAGDIEGLLPIKHVRRKVLIEQDRICNMTSQYRGVGLMRRRHVWLCITIIAAVSAAEIAQPLMARPRPLEIANAAVQRDLIYKRVNGIPLTLDLYRPEEV